jgi:hypothetical protein
MLALLGGYPALSVLLTLIGSMDLWMPWAMVVAASALLFAGLVMLKPMHEALKSSSSGGNGLVLLLFAYSFFLLYASLSTGVEWAYAGLAMVLLAVVPPYLYAKYMDEIIGKIQKNSARARLLIWFTVVLSTSVPTAFGLSKVSSVIDLIPVALYALIFGWFGLEVIPKIIPNTIRTLLLVLGYFLAIALLYGLIGTINPALASVLNGGNVILLSLIAGYAMLVSRLALGSSKNIKVENI